MAKSRDDFSAKVDEDDNANDWFMIPLVDQLVAIGMTLCDGQCYSFKKLPVLGGDYDVENTFILPVAGHYGAYGSIHRQIKDLPYGSQVVIQTDK